MKASKDAATVTKTTQQFYFTLMCFLVALLSWASLYPLMGQRTSSGLVQPTPTAGPVLQQQDKLQYIVGEIPQQNKALYLGWSGSVQTDFDFDSFFDQDFTMAAWIMPQYPNAYMGPIFSNTGSGIFLAGQGEYRSGTGDWKKEGLPVFYLQVGNYKVKYLLPEWQAGKWVHLAIKRWNNKFSLYINGQLRYPKQISNHTVTGTASEIVVPNGNYYQKPGGKLHFGNSTVSPRSNASKFNAAPAYNYNINDFQFYGLIDDIAIFNKALHPSAINSLKYAAKRINGTEADLLAAWGFDLPEYADQQTLPYKLRQAWKPLKAYKMPVSADRNSTKDAKSFLNPLVIGETKVEIRLPFKKNEVWYVVQGYDEAGGSHNGYAAFSYDFSRHNETTADVPVYASANGKVATYKMHETPPEGKIESNFVKMMIAPGEFLLYLHLAKNSQHNLIDGGTYDYEDGYYVFNNNGPVIPKDQLVAKVGPKGNHLHMSASSRTDGGTTKPVAFANYYASDDGGNTWYPVVRGHPKTGQLIKRTH